jgi:hypothetical protein
VPDKSKGGYRQVGGEYSSGNTLLTASALCRWHSNEA